MFVMSNPQVYATNEYNVGSQAAFEPLPLMAEPGTIALEKPKRPLTAYNLFFQEERQALLAELPVRTAGKPRKGHGKIGFQDMAHVISGRWRQVDPQRLAYLKQVAAADKARYKKEMKAYKAAMKNAEAAAPAAVPSLDNSPEETTSGITAMSPADPYITALARQLDRESIDFLVTALR